MTGNDRSSDDRTADDSSAPPDSADSDDIASVDDRISADDDIDADDTVGTDDAVDTDDGVSTEPTTGRATVSTDTDGDGDVPDSDDATDATDTDADADDSRTDAAPGLFDDLLSGEPIFENKDVLRPSYTPERLPHRNEQINNMATVLVGALRGETPSNILIYGKTGTGKTASAKFVSNELESTSQKYTVPCEVEYINCEVTDTQYRVLAQLANTFIDANETYIEERLAENHSLFARNRLG
jgi:cell division control protein 6